MIVDAQVHLWRDGRSTRIHRQVPTFWAEDLIAEMDSAGVDAVILCPPSFFPEGNVLYHDVVARYPERFATWGFFPIDTPDRTERIKTWRQPPQMIGFRYSFISPEERVNWTNGSMDWLWPAAEEAGLTLGFYGLGVLDIIEQKAIRHPTLKIVIDHMAADAFDVGPRAFADFPRLLELAKYPKIGVKVSGAPAQSLEEYPYRDTHDLIRRCIETFGADRCMWGTDLTRLPCSYREGVTMFTEEMPWLKGDDLKLVMGETAMRWLDWRPKGWTPSLSAAPHIGSPELQTENK